jgi:hypothetical protein
MPGSTENFSQLALYVHGIPAAVDVATECAAVALRDLFCAERAFGSDRRGYSLGGVVTERGGLLG